MESHLTTLCYVAGHSGGHITPLIARIEQEKIANPRLQSIIITSNKELDKTIIRKSSVINAAYTLPITQRRSWYYLPVLTGALVWSFIKSFIILVRHRPEKIVTTGSIVAIPACLAAWILRIPIELWEVNPTPGKTMLLLSKIATSINVCFEQTKNAFTSNHVTLAAYPIRSEVITASTPYSNPHFSSHRLTIFVQGGSQGSQGINNLIKQTMVKHPDLADKIQIIHQAGPETRQLIDTYKTAAVPAHVFAYDHAIAQYYLAADLVICRSGAGALFETLFFKKHCLTIPLENAGGGHQVENAVAMQKAYPSLITMIRQSSISHQDIYNYLKKFQLHPEHLS